MTAYMPASDEALLARLDERTEALTEGIGRIERHTAESLGRMERTTAETLDRIEKGLREVAAQTSASVAALRADQQRTSEALWTRVNKMDSRLNMMFGGVLVLQAILTLAVAAGWIST